MLVTLKKIDIDKQRLILIPRGTGSNTALSGSIIKPTGVSKPILLMTEAVITSETPINF
jgi:hypothetical protein